MLEIHPNWSVINCRYKLL